LIGTAHLQTKDGDSIPRSARSYQPAAGDEINRARQMERLLEVMQERQVTRRQTQGAQPSWCCTQNPIDRSTYALPEAQVEPFMLKVLSLSQRDRRVVIVER